MPHGSPRGQGCHLPGTATTGKPSSTIQPSMERATATTELRFRRMLDPWITFRHTLPACARK